MPTYKLTYFNARARAELCRFVFAQAGVEYEDYRITDASPGNPGTTWPELKPKTPFGKIPVLEVDGEMLGGSTGIARFLAERFGLAGSNDIENAKIWGAIDAASDLWEKMVRANFEKDEKRKEEMVKTFGETTVPEALKFFEQQASSNGAPEGWLFGTKVTYADLELYIVVADYLLKQVPTLLDSYPTLAKLKTSVEQLPNIAKWLKERPETQY